MADGEECYVQANVLHPVKEEDDAEQKQQMVVSGHHMLCTQIHEGHELHTADLLHIALITLGNAVGISIGNARCEEQQYGQKDPDHWVISFLAGH